jgi:uncharacterized protein GlcG (DUF336 family)
MFVVRCGLFAAAVTMSAPAGAQLLSHKDLSLATALTIATTAADTCKGQGNRVSVAVVGRNGEVIVQLRGDDSSPHTFENSFRKAYTSRTFRIPSGEIADRYKQDPAFFAVHLNNVIPAQGALPIKIGSARSAFPGRPAATRTRSAPRPGSTRSPTS